MNFQKLYTKHYGLLFYWVRSMVRHTEIAEDVCSFAFEKALLNQRALADDSKFRAWLYSIALNIVRESARRPMSETLEGLDIAEPRNFVDELAAKLAFERTLTAINALRPHFRAAIQRRISGKECQGVWGSRLHHARTELQEVL